MRAIHAGDHPRFTPRRVFDLTGAAQEAAATAVADALAQMGYNSIQSFSDAIALMTEEERNAEVRRLGQPLGGE